MSITVRRPEDELRGVFDTVYDVPDVAAVDRELRLIARKLGAEGLSPKLAGWMRRDRDLLLERRWYLSL